MSARRVIGRKPVFLILVAVWLGLGNSVLAATWTNGDPWSALWSRPENWDPPVVPEASDEAYVNPPPEQGPVIDQFFNIANMRGPRFDSDSNQSMYIVHGGLTVAGSWEFGDNGTGTSAIYIMEDAQASVGGEMRHRQGTSEIYISESASLTCNDWVRLADSGLAIIDISGDANVVIADDLRGGNNSGARFEAYISGGSVSVGADFKIGDYGSGAIAISGGIVNCGQLRLVSGMSSSTAALDISDGEIYVEGSTTVCEGGGAATMNISSGDVNTGHLLVAGEGGMASLNMTGGLLAVRGLFRAPAAPGSTATIDLDDGTIWCSSFTGAGPYAMDINDGVLVIDGNVTESILADVNAGYISPVADKNEVVVNYNHLRPGCTTVWAAPHLEVVPEVVGTYRGQAERAITDAFFVVGVIVEEFNDVIDAGKVISLSPMGGTMAPFGATVDLVVSLGQPNVPDVVGMISAEAITAIEAVDDLTVATVDWRYDNTVLAGLVISQEPLGGTAVPIGSVVDLVVSLGRPLVPDVVGMPEPNAIIAIELIDNLGASTVGQAYHDTVPVGSVASQEPSAGTAVLIGSTVELVVSLGKPVVPDVVGLSQSQATALIEAVSITVGTVDPQYSDTIPAGIVIGQHPVGGTTVPVGFGMTLVVSLGKPVVPSVVGQTLPEATLSIEGVDDLAVGSVTEVYHNTVLAGVVIGQDPAAGTVVMTGSTVDLVVSLGRPIVPDVIGQTEAAAILAIEAVDDLAALVTRAYHDTMPSGDVAGQDPAPGTPVNIGSLVNIVVSLGRPVVPDIVGHSAADANSMIAAVTLTVGSVTTAYDNVVPAGVVLSQSPLAGASVLIGTPVDYVVSLGKPVVPDIMGHSAADANSMIAAVTLTVGTVTSAYDNAVAVGMILSQSPTAGSSVLIGTAVNYVVSLGKPVVPDIVGQTAVDANSMIAALTLTVGTVTGAHDNTVPAGTVLNQSPAAGVSVPVGTAVDYVVSLGRPVVPDVVGQAQTDAVSAVEAVDGLTASVVQRYHNTVTAGIVVFQAPAGGLDVDVGTTVNLVVSLGRPVVPDVVGMDAADANAAIEAIDDLTVAVMYQYHDTALVGTVIDQDPVADSEVDIGSTVTILVSLGRPVVPDVVGQSQAAAVVAIGAIDHLTPVVSHTYDNAVEVGYIISQDPEAGRSVDVGSSVEIVVSLGRPIVPNVVGQTELDAVGAIAAIDALVATVTRSYDNLVTAGYVISQEPVGGTSVDVGTSVEIVVSLGRPTVPDVVGLSETAAVAAVAAVDDLVPVVTHEYHNSVPAGQVSSQDPSAGTPVDTGSTVTVVVSLGRPTVPDVVGHSEADAVTAVAAVDHLVAFSIYKYDNSIPAWIVISQDPLGGMDVQIGSTVTLAVSLGRPTVPDVAGLSEAAAVLEIESIDSLVATVIELHHDTVPAGQVISQHPQAGTSVDLGSAVTIAVSLGPPVVPAVVGLSEFDAVLAIQAIDGLMASVDYEYSAAVSEGLVINQDPPGGTVIEVGSTVTIVVSLGPTTFIILGGVRLAELQNDDGGWDQPLDDGDTGSGSDPYMFTSVALGLAQAQRENRETGDTEILAAVENAGSFLMSKVYTFAPGDGLLAVELDEILGGTEYTSYVKNNFYDQLAAGTYADARSGVFDCNTAEYIQAQRDRLSGGSANLAAWELGLGLYSAYVMGQDTSQWVAAVKAEIDELDASGGCDVLGLAGAVLGLAVVGQDHDPHAGEHAAASNLSDLAAILAEYQLDSGGFTWHAPFRVLGWDESVRETVYGLMALNEFDRAGYLSNINEASTYLESAQLASYGWPHYPEDPEDNEATGEALLGVVSARAPAGDFNNDGDEDLDDFAILALAWLTEPGDTRWNVVCDISKPNDNIIDKRDLAVFNNHWLDGAE
ncbi:MAG: PASTA domain-containing protein [Planctomycetota bacterium]